MKPYLLDINVLVALAWPTHVHHNLAQGWFANKREAGFRTCPLTQAGFVRVISNPKFNPHAVSPVTALDLLDQITLMPEHGFWPDDLELTTALRDGPAVVGHQQVTDAYLVALARARGGVVATLDRALFTFASAAGGPVELLTGEIQ